MTQGIMTSNNQIFWCSQTRGNEAFPFSGGITEEYSSDSMQRTAVHLHRSALLQPRRRS